MAHVDLRRGGKKNNNLERLAAETEFSASEDLRKNSCSVNASPLLLSICAGVKVPAKFCGLTSCSLLRGADANHNSGGLSSTEKEGNNTLCGVYFFVSVFGLSFGFLFLIQTQQSASVSSLFT